MTEIVGNSPESCLKNFSVQEDNLNALLHLGQYADDYHKKISSLAVAFTHAPLDKPLNADNLIKVVTELPEIKSNLLLNKARWFSFERLRPQDEATSLEEKEEKVESIPQFSFTPNTPSLS